MSSAELEQTADEERRTRRPPEDITPALRQHARLGVTIELVAAW